jgi:murein DD-endopeptidase MepM/ murein hydrolase activator NlpD
MRTAVAFSFGFVAGVTFLAVLLWRTHSLPVTHASVGGAPVTFAPKAQPLPVPSAMTESSAPVTIPPPAPQPNLLMPVEGVAINSLRDNFHEVRGGHLHEALDIEAPRGTPVRAATEGNVVKLFQSKAGGLTVYQFDDRQEWCFYYAHLDHYAKGLTEGALLRKGDVLGYVGTTGDASENDPHLHFAIFQLGREKRWWQGSAVDPYPYLTGQSAWPP